MKSKKEKTMQQSSSNKWETIEIDHKIFSRNKIDRMHWALKSKLKNEYKILIGNQMRINKIKKTNNKCKITIECHLKRLYDYDNVWGGLKQFIDALFNEGFIWDDSSNWLVVDTVKQIKSKEEKIIVKRLEI